MQFRRRYQCPRHQHSTPLPPRQGFADPNCQHANGLTSRQRQLTPCLHEVGSDRPSEPRLNHSDRTGDIGPSNMRSAKVKRIHSVEIGEDEQHDNERKSGELPRCLTQFIMGSTLPAVIRRMGQLLTIVASAVAIALIAGLAVCSVECHVDETAECVCICHESAAVSLDHSYLPETPFVGIVCWRSEVVESDWHDRIFRPPIA